MSIEKPKISTAVEKELPLYLQNILWYILEYPKDYQDEFHYFELDVTADENGKPMQKINYVYKTPEYQNKYLFSDESPMKINVVIKVDSSGKLTMMLAGELDRIKTL